MTAACLIIPLVKTFLAVELLFAITGCCFGLTKISVFGTIGLVTTNDKQHISMMSFIESFFMIGILSGYFIFSQYIDDKQASSAGWFQVYYVLAGLSALAFVLLAFSPLDESAAIRPDASGKRGQFKGMLRLLLLPVVVSFVVCAFIYVLIEQSIMSWLPTFNHQVLNLASTTSIRITSLLAASTAAGRFLAGVALKKWDWPKVLIGCLLAAACIVLLTMPMAGAVGRNAHPFWFGLPLAAYCFPLIGFFLAPVYPAINSVILSSVPKTLHGQMSGLIVLFSALGGTLGSIITGIVFQHYGGQTAFYFSLIPISLLIGALLVFRKARHRAGMGGAGTGNSLPGAFMKPKLERA
jgi:fucose permease